MCVTIVLILQISIEDNVIYTAHYCTLYTVNQSSTVTKSCEKVIEMYVAQNNIGIMETEYKMTERDLASSFNASEICVPTT